MLTLLCSAKAKTITQKNYKEENFFNWVFHSPALFLNYG